MKLQPSSTIHSDLVRAVEVFSQPLLAEQIVQYAYDMFVEVFSLESSGLFLKQDTGFSLVRQNHDEIEWFLEPINSNLETLPLFSAGLLTHNFSRWFSVEWIETYKPTLVVPLSMNHTLLGWIVSSGNTIDRLDEDKWQLAHSILYLIQSALQRSEQQNYLDHLGQQRNKSMYAMLALHTYTTSLLTQTCLDDLYGQAVDAFQELARSNMTSLAVWDDQRGHLAVVAYKNLNGPMRQYAQFQLKEGDASQWTGRLYDIENDLDYLQEIFISCAGLSALSVKYVILLGADKVIGMVMFDHSDVIENDKDFYEIIRLLASITYLAIIQAHQWEEVLYQRDSNQRKLHALSTLNQLTINLGHCGDLDELMTLATKTLCLRANVNRMFIILQQQGELVPHAIIGLAPFVKVSDEVTDQCLHASNDTVYDYTRQGALRWLHGLQIPADDEINCLVMVPWWRHRLRSELDQTQEIVSSDYLGCLCVMGVEGGLSEEGLLIIETIAHNAQPFLSFFL